MLSMRSQIKKKNNYTLYDAIYKFLEKEKSRDRNETVVAKDWVRGR